MKLTDTSKTATKKVTVNSLQIGDYFLDEDDTLYLISENNRCVELNTGYNYFVADFNLNLVEPITIEEIRYTKHYE